MLKGKTALVTGSPRGIGNAILEEFAQNHANIIAHARKPTREFENSLAILSQRYGISITPCYFDLTDHDALKSAIRNIIAQKIPVNILINSAGIAHGGLFQMTSMDKIREVFDINFFAQMDLTQCLLRYMIKNGGGSIVNMASVLGLDLPAGSCAYGASKAALLAFTKTLAAECGALGVRVNAIAPGLTETAMGSMMEEKAEQAMLRNCAMNRRALPVEIARAVVFLASDQASFINGQVLRVDGGSR